MRKNWWMIGTAIVLVVSLNGLAQQAEPKKEIPAGWQVRLDRANANAAEVKFWSMPPGWHATTGPAAILFDPSKTASGQFRIESESFLFPGEHAEGFGILFGGSDLAGDNQAYTYFLIRKDGHYLIKLREGSQTRNVVPWTEHAAIAKQEGDKNAKNVLAVEVGADDVGFFVNGQKVTSVPRAQLKTDGIVGLRINHRLNVHVTSLNVTPQM